jgi:ABC-type phosphate transport system substrate-binding protein
MFVSESRALKLVKSRRKPVRIAKLVTVGLALALLTGLGGSNVRATVTPIVDVVPAAGKIEGSGATFPLNQYRDWFSTFTDVYRDIKCESTTDTNGNGELDDCTDPANNVRQFDPGVSTTGLVLGYTGVGSGTGKSNFYGADCRKATQMFSGTDSLLSTTNYNMIVNGSNSGSNAGCSTSGSTPIGSSGYIMVPATAGAISMIYNLPRLLQYTSTAKSKTTAASLNLDAAAICDIYTGKIKKWNDAAIKKLNPLVKTTGTGSLPNQNIITVARAESSGTTFIFSTYLAKANDNATMRQCGFNTAFGKTGTAGRTLTTSDGTTAVANVAGDLIPQEEVLGGKFNELRKTNNGGVANPITGKAANGGIASYVKATPYAFGYVELSYQLKYSLKAAKLRTATNAAGSKANYVAPSVAGTSAALNVAYGTSAKITASKVIKPGTEAISAGGFMHAVYQTGLTSYPIVGVTWILTYTGWGTGANKNGSEVTEGQVQGLVAFLDWALDEGQASYNLYQGYAPLPAALRTAAQAELITIQWDGVRVRP